MGGISWLENVCSHNLIYFQETDIRYLVRGLRICILIPSTENAL